MPCPEPAADQSQPTSTPDNGIYSHNHSFNDPQTISFSAVPQRGKGGIGVPPNPAGAHSTLDPVSPAQRGRWASWFCPFQGRWTPARLRPELVDYTGTVQASLNCSDIPLLSNLDPGGLGCRQPFGLVPIISWVIKHKDWSGLCRKGLSAWARASQQPRCSRLQQVDQAC